MGLQRIRNNLAAEQHHHQQQTHKGDAREIRHPCHHVRTWQEDCHQWTRRHALIITSSFQNCEKEMFVIDKPPSPWCSVNGWNELRHSLCRDISNLSSFLEFSSVQSNGRPMGWEWERSSCPFVKVGPHLFLFLHLFLAVLCSMRYLSSPPGTEPVPCAVEAWSLTSEPPESSPEYAFVS